VGIPGYDAAWHGVPLTEIMTREYTLEHQELFQEFYQEIMSWMDRKPSRAHYALAEANIPVITENIDMLHQKAGSTRVIELHGNLKEGIVLRGDKIRNWDKARSLVQAAGHLLVVGCSLDMKPAGRLPWLAKENGTQISIINEAADKCVPKWLERYFYKRENAGGIQSENGK